MAEPYLGEIRLFAGTFAPRGFAFCNGQFLSIADNSALYSLLGTAYGGDGRISFALPDMRGRVVMGSGSGPALTSRALGQRFGQEEVQLTMQEMPVHKHQLQASKNPASSFVGKGNLLADTTLSVRKSYVDSSTPIKASRTLNESTIVNEGGNKAHENRQPVLGLNYIICTLGAYPSRN